MSQDVTLRSVALSAYLPAVLYSTGTGAVAPAIALTATSLGASVPTAGFVVALLAVGQICGDVPAGALAARIGEQRAMLLAVLVASVALIGCLLARSESMLGLAVFVLGTANSVFGLARQAYLTDAVPVHLRARAFSTLGGMARVGMFVGPFAAAPLVAANGPKGAYVVHLALAAVTAAVLLVVGDPVAVRNGSRPPAVGAVEVARSNARVLATLGTAGIVIGAVRASRQVVIPLWAEHLGLSPAATSVVYGLSGVVDMLVFYPSGKVMDVRGRAWVAVPSMAVLGVSHLLLPAAAGPATLVAVALLMGLGNGMGSGVVMTLGADVAPPRGRAEFLGIWRLFHDGGSALGPLLLSATASLLALSPAIVAMGGVALVGSAALARWIPRHAPVVARGARGLSVAGDTPEGNDGGPRDDEERSST